MNKPIEIEYKSLLSLKNQMKHVLKKQREFE